MLWERLRWFVHFEVVQEDYQFKLNDHYKEYYSRLIMAQEPDLADFFSLRRSIADKAA
jgi:hypothetical protein